MSSMKQLTAIFVAGQEIKVLEGKYTEGGRALLLEAPKVSLPLTIIVDGVNLRAGELVVKTWNENAPFRQALLESGQFQDTGKRISVGHAHAEIWTQVKPEDALTSETFDFGV
jgi:hypothetical protein